MLPVGQIGDRYIELIEAGAGKSGEGGGDGDAANDAVQFDFNHPLAGQPVTFEVHLIGVL